MIIDRSNKKKQKRKDSNSSKCFTKIFQIKWINYVKQIFTENCKDFCKKTSLHGYGFIFEKIGHKTPLNIRKMQKSISFVLWNTVVLTGIGFALFLMLLVLNKYQDTPTITTIETDVYPIWNIPFPGVTLCNINSVYKPGTKSITEILLRSGIQKSRIDTFYSNLAKLINYRTVESQYIQILSILEAYGYTTEKLMLELMQPCKDFVRYCQWLGQPVPCEPYIQATKSSLGFCCSFNYKLRLANEPPTNATEDSIIRVSGSGEDVGLFALLDIQPENYISPRKDFFGADILVHNPEEFPEMEITTVGQPGQDISIAVVPSVVYSDKDVESLSISWRACRFDSESHLNISKVYSFQSCMSECRAKTIVQKCSCLPFFYHNLQNGTRQCTLHDVQCLSENKHLFASWEPPLEKRIFFNKTNIGMVCDCYPSCTERKYDATVYIAHLEESVKTKKSNSTSLYRYPLSNTEGPNDFSESDPNNTNFLVVKVYFRDLTCLRYRRQMYLTWDGVLASLGGIFGLCLGGSVVSLIELSYFLTFKIFDLITNYKSMNVQSESNSRTNRPIFNVQQNNQLRFNLKKN